MANPMSKPKVHEMGLCLTLLGSFPLISPDICTGQMGCGWFIYEEHPPLVPGFARVVTFFFDNMLKTELPFSHFCISWWNSKKSSPTWQKTDAKEVLTPLLTKVDIESQLVKSTYSGEPVAIVKMEVKSSRLDVLLRMSYWGRVKPQHNESGQFKATQTADLAQNATSFQNVLHNLGVGSRCLRTYIVVCRFEKKNLFKSFIEVQIKVKIPKFREWQVLSLKPT